MKKFFNTAGPCNPEDHFIIEPVTRLQGVDTLIEQKSFFVLHAPRQSGKTTYLRALAAKLQAEGKYAAVQFSCEIGQPFGSNFEGAELALLAEIRWASASQLPAHLQPPAKWPEAPAGMQLKSALSLWAEQCPLPLVLLFDEIDALRDASLEAVLRQLRSGFPDRPKKFPQSVILCGLRDVRDYKVASGVSPQLGTASPFNVKIESLKLNLFTLQEVEFLFAQHTAQSGQAFSKEAIAKAYELSGGQPWLANALGRELVDKMQVPLSETISPEHLETAAQRLILARATHLDSLVAKLNEDRVRRVLAPLMAGAVVTGDSTYNDDVLYVRDLGLISQKDPVAIANPIYKEIIVRVLAERVTGSIVLERPSYVNHDGLLNVQAILEEFALWWKENAEIMVKGHVYHEVAAQVVFMAWLQRVVNGGGIIDREYGIGRGRIDVLVRWPTPQAKSPQQWQREAFELKLWTEGKPDPLPQGLQQLERYLDGLSLTHGTLVIFDRRPEATSPAERTSLTETKTAKGYNVRLLRA